MNYNRNKITATQKLFGLYTREISEKVVAKYGKSYQTQANVRNAWRKELNFSQEIEDFLILETKMFIRFLDPKSPNSTNLVLLRSLVNLIADYLSGYTNKNPKYATRKKAREALCSTLFENSSYIQRLYREQNPGNTPESNNKPVRENSALHKSKMLKARIDNAAKQQKQH